MLFVTIQILKKFNLITMSPWLSVNELYVIKSKLCH